MMISLLSAGITNTKALTCSKDRACGALKLFLDLLVVPDLHKTQNLTVFPQIRHF